jgi:hypothetical protein
MRANRGTHLNKLHASRPGVVSAPVREVPTEVAPTGTARVPQVVRHQREKFEPGHGCRLVLAQGA